MELIFEPKAFAVNLESSLLHKLVNINFSLGINLNIFLSAFIASTSSPQLILCQGVQGLLTVVPSAILD